MAKPQAGDAVPQFEMSADDGTTVSSDTLRGRRYVLYFYPKDDTPGCTAQACGLRDDFGRVTATGIEVFGVSPDSVKSHHKFRAKYDLPYRLLADEGHRAAEDFGVWVDKNLMGRTYKGVERSSFIVGPDGRIEHVLERVKPADHVDLVLEALAA
jgi:thioredoxin-dependent peroxiredoxin